MGDRKGEEVAHRGVGVGEVQTPCDERPRERSGGGARAPGSNHAPALNVEQGAGGERGIGKLGHTQELDLTEAN